LRQRILTLLSTLTLWSAMTIITVTPSLSRHFSLFTHIDLEEMLRFSVIFLTGSSMYLYRDRIPDSGWLALGSTALYVVGVVFPLWTYGTAPTLEFTPIDIASPFIVYPMLWLGIHLPFKRVGVKNDYSYGIYIYGWPITQLLLLWNLTRFGVVSFEFFAIAATVPFAVVSWWVIERPSLGLKSISLSRIRTSGNDDEAPTPARPPERS
jgi:peptidoglycan/LPS O-acetylase OafA/YrhL